MPVNTYTASQVIQTVLNRYDAQLPVGLASRIRTLNPARVFRILPDAEYRPHFDEYFRNFFAAINSKAFGTQYVIGIANAPNDVCGSFNCPAFCAPAVEPSGRTIYVNRGNAAATVGTLFHEFVHYLSHGNFYPEFYAMGGENPKILEGVTEFLTRRINGAVASERASLRKYQTWLDMVVSRIGSDAAAERQLAALLFRGDFSCLPTLGGVRPRV